MNSWKPWIHLPLAVLFLAGGIAAETISGQVVDQNGIGVPFVNLDIISSTGNDPNVSGGGTDANGFFSTTVTPAGVYDIIFEPPAPPTTSLLTLVQSNVVIVGVVNVGAVPLAPGVILSGRCIDSGALPVGSVNIDVIDQATGLELPTNNDSTNGFGNFSITVPPTSIELQFDASGIIGRTLVSESISVTPLAPLNLGDVLLVTGFVVTGTIAQVGGIPVVNADVDAKDAVTGIKVFTPGDNTDALGVFTLTVPPGTFDFDACPPEGLLVVGVGVESQAVTGPMGLGTLEMAPGVVLSGIVLDASGVPLVDVDIDVEYASTGLEVILCGDDTASDGSYSIVVPADAVEIEFNPSFSFPLAGHSESLVLVSNTLLDVMLQPCPFGVGYGMGLAGTGGLVPRMTTTGGAPRVANKDFRYRVERALPGAPVLVINSFNPLSFSFLGGTILVDFRKAVSVSRFRIADAAGEAELTLPLPPSFLLGTNLFSQALVFDPMTPQGWAMTRGLFTQICL